MDVAGVQFVIDPSPAEAGSRRAIGAIEVLEKRLDAFLVKAKQMQKELGGALSFGGGRGGGSGDGGAGFSKAEAAAVRHAQRLEQIAAQSSARVAEIERKKQSQIDAARERVAIQEQARQRRAAAAPTDAGAFFKRYASTIREAGESLQQTGYFLSGITVGFLRVGEAAVKSAIDIDKNVNTLKSLLGSTQAAEARFRQLTALSQSTPGLTTNLAATLDAQLRVAGATEAAINKVLPAVGKLNAVSKIGDPTGFARNLTQLISQNFEKADLKELVGQSPLAGEIIKQVFSVDSAVDGEAIRRSAQKLGLTTVDTFFRAFGEAAATNSKLANVTESIESRFAKLTDRVAVALRPLGTAILDAIAPFLEKAAVLIEKFGSAFSALPSGVQTAIVALAGLAAVIGPVVIGFGAITQAIGAFGNLVTVAKALGGVTAALQATSAAATVAEGAVASAGAATSAGLLASLAPLLPILLAVAAVLGVIAIAWANYESATEKAAKITVEQVQATAAQRDQFALLANRMKDTTQAHNELANALSVISPNAQSVAGALQSEGEKIAFVTDELTRQKEIRDAVLVSQRTSLASALADQQKELDAIRERRKELEAEAGILAKRAQAGETFSLTLGKGLLGGVERQFTTTLSGLSDVGALIEEARKQEQEANKVRNETAQKLEASQRALGGTTNELLTFQKQAGASTGSLDALNKGLSESQQQQAGARSAILDTNDALNAQAAAGAKAAAEITEAFNAVDIAGLQKGIRDKVQEITKQAVESGGGIKKAAQLLKEARGQVAGGVLSGKPFTLDDAAKRTADAQNINDFLLQQLTPKRRSGGGGGGRGSSSDNGANALRDAQIALAEARESKLLQIERAGIERRQREIDAGLQDQLISVRDYYQQKQRLAEADAQLDIRRQEKTIAEQQKKVDEVRAALPAQLAKARTDAQKNAVSNRAETEITQATTKIVQAETQIAEINAKVRGSVEADARAERQALKSLEDSVFDVRRAFLELSSQSYTATIEADTKRANEEIQKLFVNGKFIAALQAAQNRDVRNNRTRAAGIGESVDARRQETELGKLRIQNDLVTGVIGEGEARQRTLESEQKLQESLATRLKLQLLFAGNDEKAVLAIRRQIEELRTLATDERALREERAKGGFLNDKAFVDTAKSQAKDARLSEQENTAKEIIRLQDQIATAGEGSADRIQLAYLKAFRGIQEENERAAEEVIAAQVKLQNNLNVDPTRLNDGVIKLLATQKTLQESLQDFRTAQVQTVFDGIEKGVDKLTEKFGVAGKAIGQLLKDLAKLAVSKLLEKVLGISPTGTQSVAPQQQGGGGILGGLFGGGQQGGGGLLGGLFGGNRQQSSGGGLLGGLFGGGNRQAGASSGGGLLGGLFGGGGQSSPASFLTGGFAGGNPAQAALGGQGGSGLLGNVLGGSRIGGLLSKIPLVGRLFGGGGSSIAPIIGGGGFGAGGAGLAAGAAGSAGSAGASAGGFGALFSNPVTAAIAIGAIAAPFVIKLFKGLFGGGEFKKFRAQVQGLYQIKVDGKQEGKSLFEAVKGLGEQAFGKGSFKNKISETIQLKKAQEAIAAYGESTGQTDSPLVKKFIKKREVGDATASENNFVRRATGGIVPGVDTGKDYVRALLRGGEFVTVPEVVQSQGKGRFDALNKGDARIMTNREIENLRRALQSVPFFSRGMRERILGQLNLRESVSSASFNHGYGNGGYVMPATQAFASGGYVFPQTSAQQAQIEQSTSRAQASNAAQSVATGAQASQAASQREAALTNEIRGNRVVMARLVEVIERLDGFDANTIVGMASPDTVASKTVEGFQSDSTIASRAQQGLGLRT